ncbi:MAG: hypothetical protein IH898_07645, partial [Planctomycetes bacterium]|nr:hypothetical protein [Planctomycetota bacterium]
MTLSEPVVYLSLLVFLPVLAALVLALLPKVTDDALKLITLAVTIMVFLLSLGLMRQGVGIDFQAGVAEMQVMFTVDWIPSFGIQYFMALDGISFPLVVLTSFLCVLAMAASWSIDKHVKAYCILFLLLETGMIGVFMALDFFLFYVFWEVMLLPMYFLIGVWGGPRREYAAIKFFLYTLVGSVLMLIAILMLYFNSDLTRLDAEQLADAGIIKISDHANAVAKFTPSARAEFALAQWLESDTPLARRFVEITSEPDPTQRKPLHTFNILALQQMGQH